MLARMSKYFFTTGAILVVMVTLDALLFGTIDLLSGTGILFALIFLLAPIYRAKLNLWINVGVSIVLIIISIVTNLVFIFLVIFVCANLPKGKPFEAKVIVEPPSKVEMSAYKRLININQKLRKECFLLPSDWNPDNLFDYTFSGMDKLLSSECEAERAKLLNFYAENVFSIPILKHKDEYFVSINIELPNFSYLMNTYRIELSDIAKRLDKGDVKIAQQKYVRLWQATENQLSGRINTLIQTMVSVAEMGFLTEFYSKYADKLKLEHNEELINILQNIIPKMDSAITGSFVGEYAFQKGIIIKSLEAGWAEVAEVFSMGTPTSTTRLVEKRLLKWPFYDTYKTREMLDEFFYKTIELARKPMYEIKEEEKEDLQGYDKKLEETKPSFAWFENPVGNFLHAIIIPRTIPLISRKEVKKAQATAMLYLLSVSNPNNPDEIPIDNLTGKRFRVTFQNNTLEIQSEHKDYKTDVYLKIKK